MSLFLQSILIKFVFFRSGLTELYSFSRSFVKIRILSTVRWRKLHSFCSPLTKFLFLPWLFYKVRIYSAMIWWNSLFNVTFNKTRAFLITFVLISFFPWLWRKYHFFKIFCQISHFLRVFLMNLTHFAWFFQRNLHFLSKFVFFSRCFIEN